MASELFSKLEQKHGLPSGLLDAVWATESGRGKNMLSPAGARGHFQFMPATAQQYGLTNPDDLNQSAEAAARMYGDLFRKYGGDMPKALAAYNWGQGNLDRQGLEKAPAETRNYINKITSKVQPMTGRDLSAELFGDVQESPSKGRDLSAELFGNEKPKKTAKNYASDVAGGLVRGAGSIGATLIRPFESADENKQRRASMDAALADLIGADPESLGYQGGKLVSEIAGTLPVGGLMGKAVGGAAKAVGLGAKAAPLVQSIATSGFNAGGKTGLAGLATRAVGGAVSGGATAGLVNPEDAATGAVVGGVMPVAVQGVGRAAEAYGQSRAKKAAEVAAQFARNAPRNQTVKAAVDAGYVIPPNMVNPTFKNQVVESISGKQATQQLFSEKNEKVTGSLVRKALGIPDDAPLTQQALENLRKTAGRAYADVSSLSKQAADDLEALKVARNEAQGWFQAYNRSARPDDLAKAKAARELSTQLEDALEKHAANAGRQELIPSLRDARKQIAKTYTVGRALNDASGTVDARVLGRMYEKGLPLSDGLDVAGRFASAFPTVAKSSQQVGSPAAHNLKALASGGLGLGGVASLGPAGLIAGAVPFVAPPVARAAMLRKGVQESLTKQAPKAIKDPALVKLLADPEIQRLLLRSAPAMSAD